MTPTYDDSPEVAGGHDLPEAYISQPPQQVWSPQPSIAPTYVSTPAGYGHNGQYTDAVKSGSAGGAVGGVVADEAAYTTPESTIPEKKAAAATAGGISLVVILSIIIAILSAAVIGLAAGTGVATKNYNDANSKLRVLSSSLAAAQATGPPSQTTGSDGSSGTSTSSSSSGSATPNFNSITNGCTDNAEDVNGLIYHSPFFGNANFTMYCEKDTINTPLYSLFAINFNGCMDACAGWNHYNSTAGTCLAVSFIPSWSVAATALAGSAPGDCYLKPGPITSKNLTTPNIGAEIDAALLIAQQGVKL